MKKYILEPKEEMTVLDALKQKEIMLSAECGGHGTCGKCKVLINGKEYLACKTLINKKTEVEIPEESRLDGIYVENIDSRISGKESFYTDLCGKSFFICVDIGTTTIAAVLTDESGKIIASAGCANSQRSFGADVISRIEAAECGYALKLKKLVRSDISRLKTELAQKANIKEDDISKVIISANTVMEHLFMGLDTGGFAKAPYRAVTLGTMRENELELIAGLTPFVGADILGGIAACKIDRNEKLTALIDLGTNGEMAVGSKNGILIASTAAGPVFEGGGISCGVPALPGAIYDIEISGMRVFARTIDNAEPIGLCGTGVVDAVCELRKNGLIDKNGIFSEEFIDDGFPITSDIYITKDDIRNFQIAKAAIAAGFRTLCAKLKVECSEIETLYIAGGFGKHINIEKAAKIGLIPEELKDKCVLAGNTSLSGALIRGAGDLDDQRISVIKGLCEEIILAESEHFQHEYVRNMQL